MNTTETPDFDISTILPHLPKPNLDDRTYKDNVNECVLRIPRYTPEWSNHNPADPGITLIELFSWLTDQMLWRFNQVPQRQYIAFLELLGIRLAPPHPAQTAITFYLSRPQSKQSAIGPIAAGAEVSTERTDNQEAVIFSTQNRLTIGTPFIENFLLSENIQSDSTLNLGDVQDGFYGWTPQNEDKYKWSGQREKSIFEPTPKVKNGFYLILGSETLESGQMQSLDGHVLSLEIGGQLAGPTGINPKRPPRRWEAWNGQNWQPVLLSESHDETLGFSFDEMQASQQGIRRGKITLHMPTTWPQETFRSRTGAPYTGFGLRCLYDEPNDHQLPNYSRNKPEKPRYQRSPKIRSLAVSAMGGTVAAIQCTQVTEELLGESTGKPGQQFSLQSTAILARETGEYLNVTSPNHDAPDAWTEVPDFSDSAAEDLHYTLDSRTGTIQLGPVVREPAQLQQAVQLRQQIQQNREPVSSTVLDENSRLQQQYGKVPAKGAILRMAAYRTGGGEVGNVKPGALHILKSAVPYVASVTNHRAATGGTDAETLEQAIMRVPRLLRTRDRAVTAEDFETLAKQSSHQVYRVKCVQNSADTAGKVVVLVVPAQAETSVGFERFQLTPELQTTIEGFLTQRSLLGIAIQVKSPDYVRVKVRASVSLAEDYRIRGQSRQDLETALKTHLYTFLNPITGGWSGNGWEFGAALSASDIMGYLHKQQVPGVRAIGNIQLLSWDHRLRQWRQHDSILLGPSQLIDSWESEHHSIDSHIVEFV